MNENFDREKLTGNYIKEKYPELMYPNKKSGVFFVDLSEYDVNLRKRKKEPKNTLEIVYCIVTIIVIIVLIFLLLFHNHIFHDQVCGVSSFFGG